MQTSATYKLIVVTDKAPALSGNKAARASQSRLLRTLVQRWDLIGVVSLMLSSGAYGLYALSHLAHF